MCIICVDYQKGLLTTEEAWRNLGEMVIDSDHRQEVMELILKPDED